MKVEEKVSHLSPPPAPSAVVLAKKTRKIGGERRRPPLPLSSPPPPFSYLPQHVDLLEPRVPGPHPLHQRVEPARPLPAGRALPARLVLVKVRQPRDRVDDVGRLVHDDDRGRAEPRLRLLERVKVHEHVVADVLRQEGHGRAARDDAQEVVPAAAHAAGVPLDQLAQRDRQLVLDRARPVDVPRDAEELGAPVVLAPERREPVRAAPQDRRRDRDRLDVGDGRRAAVEPDVGRERRLEPRLALLALERLDQRRLLAADVGAGAPVHVDVEVDPGAAGVFSQEPLGVRLGDGPLQREALVDVLPADVDVGRPGSHGRPGDEAAVFRFIYEFCLPM